uniref:Uncharacterized protein n=1 Tax=Anguilla anguilla TaxID=7936 RepID=A0A0E9PID2_ANGAN
MFSDMTRTAKPRLNNDILYVFYIFAKALSTVWHKAF